MLHSETKKSSLNEGKIFCSKNVPIGEGESYIKLRYYGLCFPGTFFRLTVSN